MAAMNSCSNQVVRHKLMELNAKRSSIEKEITTELEILSACNCNMTDDLVDSEGFPRNDIDIYRVRICRNKIISLQNDARSVNKEIEDLLPEYFQQCSEK